MKALLSHAVGGAETLVLSDVPDPVAGDGQVVVKVAACGVNFPDALIIEDKYQFKPQRPFAPGGEIAGTVESLGEGVTHVHVGQRVLAFPGWGGMAEKVVIQARRCIPIPDTMPFADAAAFLMTYGTSHYALKNRANLKAGETLLVLGAAGGVGSAAIELAKAMGARVIAAASSQEKVDAAVSWGAESGVVYPRGPFDRDGQKALADLFKKAGGEKGPDVIYDAVGGDYAEAALRSIGWNGRFLVIGFPAGIPKLPLNLTLLKGCSVVGVFWGSFTEREPKEFARSCAELLALYEKGAIKPRVSKTYPLAKGGEAIAWLSQRNAVGKVVVTMP